MSTEGFNLVRETAIPGEIEQAFRDGCALAVPWRHSLEEIRSSLATIERYLAGVTEEISYGGVAGQRGLRRESVWLATTGLGAPLHTEADQIQHFDGGLDGGLRGLEMLAHPEVVDALTVLKDETDTALRKSMVALGMTADLPRAVRERLTVRYRVSRYAPVTKDSGIGVHPDGCVLATVITDRPGLLVFGGQGRVERPSPDVGTVVLPGSILTRWSDGALLPVVHAATVVQGEPTKTSLVGFLNFADHSDVPRSARFTSRAQPFRNRIRWAKDDDEQPADGGLAGFYRERGFTVEEEGVVRFRTYEELVEGTPES